ncbi:hypothetical protein AVEN_256295-1 [Araneus ventricosus]|uniref:Uncharacterized protein n=1 Tax=Araneus ventricosus TaxID=182803 RepID=A0A4Y2C7I1_ARAVE|nr:hypothetical protein AVEN_256295-1 [Araneus ventricosus]
MGNFATTSAGELLDLADTHSDSDLRKSVEDFILEHEKEVFSLKEWELLMKTNPQQAMKTMHFVLKFSISAKSKIQTISVFCLGKNLKFIQVTHPENLLLRTPVEIQEKIQSSHISLSEDSATKLFGRSWFTRRVKGGGRINGALQTY